MTEHTYPRRPRSRIRLPLWGVAVLIVLLLSLLGGSGWWTFHTAQVLASSWEVTEPNFAVNTEPDNAADTMTPAVVVDDTEVGETPLLTLDALRPWAGQERINILLLGIDQRCGETGPTRTDSMMVVTIDPVGMTAAGVSLPRDLWVEIPGFGVDRINQAHYLGDVHEYPGGGTALAMETVANTLGIPIHYFAAVNFTAFVDFVDLIGGIDVDVEETIDDRKYPDNCYGYEPFYIEAGPQHLDGTTALKYARTRATLGGDVDRAHRQQQVVLAVRERILTAGQAPQLVTQAPQLWLTFQENVRTNMTLDEAIQLALLVQDIPRSSIRTAVIDYNYVYTETRPDGQQVLVPLRDKIRDLRNDIFAPPAVPTAVVEDLPQLMAAEGARVVIYNGTRVFGLAAETQAYLQGFGVNVVDIGNADTALYRSIRIIDYGNHPHTTRYLSQLMDVPPLNISYDVNPPGDFDVLVILGGDWTPADG